MQQATNIPYRKEYDEQGLPINPGTVRNDGSNRRGRREIMQKQRAFNNSRNVQQVVNKRNRWLKKKQLVIEGNGKQKVINHLIFAR